MEKMIRLYITLRNRIPGRGTLLTPLEKMSVPVSKAQQAHERKRLRDHMAAREEPQSDQIKRDRLHGLIRYNDIAVEPAALKRAEKTIKAFEKEAISAAEKVFVKALNRKSERKNLAYFFGILKRIQQERDDEAYRRYCHRRYNEQVLVELKSQDQQSQNSHTVEGIVTMLVKAVETKFPFVKELATKKAREWTRELTQSYRYPGALKNSFSKKIDDLKDLSLEKRSEVLQFIDQFLVHKIKVESVTQVS